MVKSQYINSKSITLKNATYIQQTIERVINNLGIIDGNPGDTIVAVFVFVHNSITVGINHFEIGIDEGFHRLIKTMAYFCF